MGRVFKSTIVVYSTEEWFNETFEKAKNELLEYGSTEALCSQWTSEVISEEELLSNDSKLNRYLHDFFFSEGTVVFEDVEELLDHLDDPEPYSIYDDDEYEFWDEETEK
jgi:hypothetical protein